MNILLVDDDEIIRKGMRKMIEKNSEDWNVVGEAADGELALQILNKDPSVDLVITDIRMPIMDGLELVKAIRQKNFTVKIIVLSGFDDFRYVRDAFMDGVADYLLKPIKKAELFSLLEKIDQSMIADTRNENNRKKSKQLLIADILDKLFHQEEVDIRDNIEAIENLGISFQGKRFYVMVTRIDLCYKQKFEKEEYENRSGIIFQKIADYFQSKKEYELLQYINKLEIISLVIMKEFVNNTETVNEIFYSLNDVEEEDKTCTIGYGNVYSGSEDLRRAFQEAVEAADTRFYLGRNQKIDFNQIEKKCIDMQYNLEPHVGQMAHFLELCDYVHAKREMEQVFLDLSYLKPFKFRKYMQDLMILMSARVKDFENAVIYNEHDYKFNIEYLNTYKELKAYMNSILQSSIEFIRSERDKRSKRRIEMAKDYIENHYMEPITLNDAADYVELNPSYFSNLFKSEIGINFSDFLLNTRMNMAKRLLRNPKIKVYEIGSMVGYEDAVSFGRAFKKKIGMSPKEYRNTVY